MATKDPATVKFRCRVSYVFLAEPGKPMEGQEDDTPKYRMECRIPKGDPSLKEIREAMKFAWIKKFGSDKDNWKPLFREEGFFENHLCLSDSDGFFLRDGSYHSGDSSEYKDEVYFSASNKIRPICGKYVKGGWKNLSGDPESIRETIYSGCYCDVVIKCFAYDNKKKGIGASLQAVIFAEDGERLGGGRLSDKAMTDMFGEAVDSEAEEGDDLLV